MKGELLLLLGMGVVIVRHCCLCVPDSPGRASWFVCDIHNSIDILSKPASISTNQLPIWYLGNTVLKYILHKNCHRSNRLSLTIYAIVFLYRFFSCTGSSKKCNVFTFLLSFSQFTKELELDILSMVFLNDIYTTVRYMISYSE